VASPIDVGSRAYRCVILEGPAGVEGPNLKRLGPKQPES